MRVTHNLARKEPPRGPFLFNFVKPANPKLKLEFPNEENLNPKIHNLVLASSHFIQKTAEKNKQTAEKISKRLKRNKQTAENIRKKMKTKKSKRLNK